MKSKNAEPYLTEPLNLPVSERELFFDIEVDPMQDFCYLHGFVERSNGDKNTEKYVAFYAEDLFPEDDGSSEVAASDVGDTVSQEEDASHVDSKEEFRNLFSGEDSNFSELQDKGEPAPDETGLATPIA